MARTAIVVLITSGRIMQTTIQEPLSRRIGIVMLVMLAVVLSWWQILDAISRASVDGILVQAVSAYGIARIADGTLSLLQSIELSIPLVGGAAIAPLQVLSPWHELVSRFAALMELSIGSLILQKLLMEMVATRLFQWLYMGVGILFVAGLFVRRLYNKGLWFRLFLTLSFARYAMIIVALLNGMVDEDFIRARTTSDMANMSQISQAMDAAGMTPEEAAARQESMTRMVALRREVLAMETQRHKMQEVLMHNKDAFDSAAQDVRKERSGMSLKERFDGLTADDKNMTSAEKTLRDTRNSYQAAATQLREMEQKIAEVNKQVADIEQGIQGRTSVLLKKIASEGSNLFDTAVEKINGLLDSVLRLMTLFVLQAMLLPLLFLWAVRRFMLVIWRIDLAALLDKRSPTS